MLITRRRMLLILAAVIVAAGAALALLHADAVGLGLLIAGCGLAAGGIAWRLPEHSRCAGPSEPPDVNELTQQRRRELVRGTSLYLREQRYRYSIRIDPEPPCEHPPFSADVNSITLGFVPVVIIDNANDREGHGYVAFVHDGRRWRGPGLPCPAGQAQAVQHAAKCVSPLGAQGSHPPKIADGAPPRPEDRT